MGKIQSLAYVVAQSTDVSKWQQYGEQMLGAMTATAAGGGLFVKLDERDFRMAIVPGAEDRYLASGWEVASEADFKAAIAAIEKAGVAVTPGSVELKKARGFKDVATFADPSGNQHELVWLCRRQHPLCLADRRDRLQDRQAGHGPHRAADAQL
jgi:3,4-dihydroxy-9,10-secoandrosta-1,3,5(10)-triene-9,17-dione 4,5-dioxygenase